MRALSLFSGIGGFDLAFERAGIQIAQQCEIDPRCRELLGKRFVGTPCSEDVRDVKTTDADVICGGFPCQDISVAGNRAGLAGERSGLWYEFARIIDTARPRWVVVENVAGLLSSNRGRDLGTILATLGDLGYGWFYRVLDAQFFGVPQRRRRVFIVGHRGDARRASEVLLEPEGGCWNPPSRSDAGPITTAFTKSSLSGGVDDNNAQGNHLIAVPETAGALTGRIDRGGVNSEGNDGHLVAAFHNARTLHADGEVVESYNPADISNALTQPFGNKGTVVVHPILQTFDWQVAGSPRTWIHDKPGGSTRSLTASKTLAVHAINAAELGVRKLMPLECERLQGFPDGWTEGYPDTTRYRMLGNAVAVPVVEWIARRLVAA